jgi:hypothetical protein
VIIILFFLILSNLSFLFSASDPPGEAAASSTKVRKIMLFPVQFSNSSIVVCFKGTVASDCVRPDSDSFRRNRIGEGILAYKKKELILVFEYLLKNLSSY